MRKLIVFALLVNAMLLAGRFWEELPANAQERPVATRNGDVNGDTRRDIADAIYLLGWLFQGGPAPVALAQGGALTPKQEAILDHAEEVLSFFRLIPGDTDGAAAAVLPAVTGDTLLIEGVNVQIVNGLGSTAAVNGLGNLIVGYQSLRISDGPGPLPIGEGDLVSDHRTGSHNIIVGDENSYSGFGGLIVGKNNAQGEVLCIPELGNCSGPAESGAYCSVIGGSLNWVTGQHSSVFGGRKNSARGEASTVTGGFRNEAVGQRSSVSGGSENHARGDYASVSGGRANSASGGYSSVSGGERNAAYGGYSSVSGGKFNRAGTFDGANGRYASVSGGRNNQALGGYSSVSGGRHNEALGDHSSVTGGGGENLEAGNLAIGPYSSVSGGRMNAAGSTDVPSAGLAASVCGGTENVAFAEHSAILGGFRNFTGHRQAVDPTLGEGSTVSGGQLNTASGLRASVSGGHSSDATGVASSVSGGSNNTASASISTVSGGRSNVADGTYATVSGGEENRASGGSSAVSGGFRNRASHFYTSVSSGCSRWEGIPPCVK